MVAATATTIEATVPPIKGLSAFPVTPADAVGRVDVAALAALLERLVAAGVDSIGLLGSTGSYPYLDRAERRRGVAAAREAVGGRVPLLVGVGALRTDEAVALARDAREAGVDAGLLAPVSYQPLTDEEVFEHFRAVTAAGLPLVIYNNPATTRFTFSPDLVGRLAALPGIVAVKDPAPPPDGVAAAVRALREVVPGSFSVGFSVDWHAPAALLAGGDAWYSVVGGTFPAATARLCAAARGGHAAEVGRLMAGMEPLWALFRRFGSYRVMHRAAGIAPPRPVLPLDGEAAREVDAVLERLALD